MEVKIKARQWLALALFVERPTEALQKVAKRCQCAILLQRTARDAAQIAKIFIFFGQLFRLSALSFCSAPRHKKDTASIRAAKIVTKNSTM